MNRTAVVKESLRISPNVASPLLRIVPAAGATIDKASIPAGVVFLTLYNAANNGKQTIVGMSGVFDHNSEQIFKDALKFDPDR
jgi:cytochrome P450